MPLFENTQILLGEGEKLMSIKIDLKIFLFLFLFLLTSQIEIYILLMVFAIIHELGHLLAGVLLKFKPNEMRLTPFGLQISFDIDVQKYNQRNKELAIKKAINALAGPTINLLIAAVMIAVAKFGVNIYVYQIIIYSNFVIGLFNLIPIYPMDGGRVLKEILKLAFGNKKAYKYTYLVSKTVLILLTVVASITILYIHNIAIVLILGYLWYLEVLEIRRYNRRKEIERLVEGV